MFRAVKVSVCNNDSCIRFDLFRARRITGNYNLTGNLYVDRQDSISVMTGSVFFYMDVSFYTAALLNWQKSINKISKQKKNDDKMI